jgi:hypothetical protein
MGILGGLLIFLSLPLLIGYFLGAKKNISFRNLGVLMFVIGLIVAVIPT